jgi:hypothetical protein
VASPETAGHLVIVLRPSRVSSLDGGGRKDQVGGQRSPQLRGSNDIDNSNRDSVRLSVRSIGSGPYAMGQTATAAVPRRQGAKLKTALGAATGSAFLRVAWSFN